MGMPKLITELPSASIGVGTVVPAVVSGVTSYVSLDFVQSGTGAVAETMSGWARREGFYATSFMTEAERSDVTSFTGSVDVSTALQAAIDYVASIGGGNVFCPLGYYKCNVILKAGVVLVGQPGAHGYTPSATTKRVRFSANATGVVIDTPAAETVGCGVVGIDVYGLGAATACVGIRFRNVKWGVVRDVQVDNFADEGILQVAGVACQFHRVLILNCLLDRSRAAKAGCLDLAGADHYVSYVEAGASLQTDLAAKTDANLYCCAIVVRGGNQFYDSCVAELSDVGFHVLTAGQCGFTNCRADTNYGNGWEVVVGSNRFSNCYSMNNSKDANDTYSEFLATAGHNVFTGCVANSLSTNKAKYGFEDTVNNATNKNFYINCYSIGAVTAQYWNQTSESSAFFFASGTPKTLTANSATPSVTGYEHFVTANSSTTTVTDFTGGVRGQKLYLHCNDANTTIQHNGSTIITPGGGDVKLRSGSSYVLWKNGPWRLLHEDASQYANVTSDVGDAAKTLQYRRDPTTQRWNTPIAADRAVTLSTTGAIAGAHFHIVRSAAATGAFNLNVGTGPLKALGIGEWCDVEYDGSAWFLSAYGAL